MKYSDLKSILSFIFFILFCWFEKTNAQPLNYTLAQAHSHNDYLNDIPFLRSFKKGFGSIEIDIFPLGNKLYVAHDEDKIRIDRSLETLYLQPLFRELKSDTTRQISLLIDIKKDYKSSIPLLIKELHPLSEFLQNKRLQIVISGYRPSPSEFKDYPVFISFDNDQSQSCTEEQWKRVALVSLPFTRFSTWNGKGRIVNAEAIRIKNTVDSVHNAGKKMRFWATPEGPTSWLALMKLGVDFIGTDEVEELGTFLLKLPKNQYSSHEEYQVYQPSTSGDGSRVKVKNIILCIGDGMGLNQLYSAFTSNRGKLNIFQIQNIGFSLTNAADAYGTDSAAGATAMASGIKTNNRAIGVDVHNTPVKSLFDYSQEVGKKNALIVTCDITDATPAAFYAHVKDRSESKRIAQYFSSIKADIILGAGMQHFKDTLSGSKSLMQLKAKGFHVTSNYSDFLSSKSPKIAAILSDENMRPVMDGRGLILAETLSKVVNILSSNKEGFFVMIEGSQIDHGGHANNIEQIITETCDFDKMVGEALRFADKNKETLVIVTADHETGGLTLMDGDIKKGSVTSGFSTADHTGVPVPVFAYGPYSDIFKGIYHNTHLFEKIFSLMK